MRRSTVAILAAVATLASCADLFDDAVQCKSDSNCEKFGATCDLARAVCTARGESGVDASIVDPPTVPPVEEAGVTTMEDSAVPPGRCSVVPKTSGVIGKKLDGGTRAEISGAVTLGCEKDWVLDAIVFVKAGATLTIEAGTTIRAKKGSGAAIVVSTGGRIIANGKKDEPIVFTSDAVAPAPGDWRGIFVLGLAPPGGEPPFENDPDLAWGGTNADDDSGVLSFVRIEYAKNGLTFAGAGRKTKIDFVQVRRTVQNCFMFFGGRADSKHLVCQSAGRNQFEWWYGYAGRSQFLYSQKAALPPLFNSHGLLVDDAKPVIYNATICGDKPTALNGYGVLFRDNGTLNLNGAIVTGWFGGIDASGNLPNPGGVRASVLFGNATNPAYAEDPGEPNQNLPTFDDDNGFDELAMFGAAAPANVVTDPKLVDCFDPKVPKPWPTVTLTTNAPAPPVDGFFDSNAKYIGAFKDESDLWMKGAWVRFDDK